MSRSDAIAPGSYRCEGEKRRESWTSSGGYDSFAEYDWYFQGDGSFDFTKPGVQSGHGKLRWGPSFRLGHGLILSGPRDANRSVDCGSFHVWWSYPMNFSFFSFVEGKGETDWKLQISPTRWTDIGQVDFANPRLKWTNSTSAAQQKEDIWVPLEDLP